MPEVPMRLLTILAYSVALYAAMLVLAALVVWMGPGFGDLNGQLMLLFCAFIGFPAAFNTASRIVKQ
jgi:hypothetical protein